jgi:hypothetical protein
MLVLVFLAGFLVTGCANSPRVSEEIPWQQVKAEIPAGKALVYVVRPFSNAAAGNKYSIRINGTHIVDMKTGTYFSYLAPAGEVHISAETVPNILNLGLALAFMGKPELTSKAGPGEIVFINVEVAFSGGPKLTSVESGLGERLVKDASKIEALR